MNYSKFKETVLEELKDFYGKDAAVSVQEVLKNNGVILDGINIRFNKEDTNIVPIIYLNDFYDKYIDGELELEDIVGRIIGARDKYSVSELECESVLKLQEWDSVKNRVFPILISAEANKVALEKYISKMYLDLAVVYIIRIGEGLCDGVGSVKITKELFAGYSISEEELHEQSVKNLAVEGYRLKDMMEVMADILSNNDLHDAADLASITELENGKMYVLSNRCNIYGAAGVLDLEMLRKLGRSCFILPSSVHETILVPDEEDTDQDSLDGMVQEVNATQLAKEEVLADHSYYYDYSKNEIRIRKIA